MESSPRFEPSARAAVVFWAVALGFGFVALGLWYTAQALLLVFAGVLFGTSLRGAAEWLAGRLRWRVAPALAVCIGALLAISAVSILLIVPRVGDQATELADRLSAAYTELHARASETSVGERLLEGTANLGRYVGHAAGVAWSAIGLLGTYLFVMFVALYVAISPQVYRHGIVRLVSPPHRERASQLLVELARTLRRWMLGRIVSMTAVGVATAVGLMVLDIPLAITLGLLAGLLGFVPNIGPIVSAVPALLIALTVSTTSALWVGLLYVAINLADGYGLTPLVEKRSVSTPPALVLVAQLVFGALWGIMGLTLATPLLACLVVLVHRLYVEGVLERRRAMVDRETAGA